jgi:hypothetical protein
MEQEMSVVDVMVGSVVLYIFTVSLFVVVPVKGIRGRSLSVYPVV